MGPQDFFEACEAAFAQAAGAAGTTDLWLTIAGRRVRLRCAGAALTATLDTAFRHLRRPPAPHADFTVSLWDHVETGVPLPPRPWLAPAEGVRGWVKGFGEGRFDISTHPVQVSVLDRVHQRAIHWVRGARNLDSWDIYHPLRTLLFAWGRSLGLSMVHAGAVGFDEEGVMLVGPGGSGKSTAVLACIGAGGRAAGDDYVLIGDDRPPLAHSVFGAMRLFRHHAERFPALLPGPDSEAPGHDGTPKFTSFIARHRPAGLVDAVRVAAVVVPRVAAGGRTRAARVSGGAALLALAPTSLSQLDPQDRGAFERMSRLCRDVPCWRLDLGTEIDAIAEGVRGIIAESRSAPAAGTAPGGGQ